MDGHQARLDLATSRTAGVVLSQTTSLLAFRFRFGSGRRLGRDVRFADIAEHSGLKRLAVASVEAFMRLGDRLGGHEFGDAWCADDVSARFGDLLPECAYPGQNFSIILEPIMGGIYFYFICFLMFIFVWGRTRKWTKGDRIGDSDVRIVLSPFVRAFLQLGQTRDTLSEPSSAFSSVK
jgi:hypothetical protein